jgi:hypothetical protein
VGWSGLAEVRMVDGDFATGRSSNRVLSIKDTTVRRFYEIVDWVRERSKLAVTGLVFVVLGLSEWYSAYGFLCAAYKWSTPYRKPAIDFILGGWGRTSLIVFGFLLLWIDSRRKKRPIRHSPRTLKGRVLQLKDDLQAFLDSLPAEVQPDAGRTQRDWTDAKDMVEWRLCDSLRRDKLHYGYELRFADRAKKVIAELGERGELNPLRPVVKEGELNFLLPDAFDARRKEDKEIKEIINQLGLVADRLPD